MQRNLPADLESLPALYKQFNFLSNIWLKENYPECENENGNSQDYRCYLKLYSNAASGRNSITFYLGDKIFAYDRIQGILDFVVSQNAKHFSKLESQPGVSSP